MAVAGFLLGCLGVAALVGTAGSLGSVALWRLAASRVSRWSAARRADLAFALGVAPALAVLAVVVATAVPSLMTVAGLSADHCTDHAHHVHLCLLHAESNPTALLWLGACAAAVLLFRAGLAVASARSQHRRLAALEGLGRTHEIAGFPAHAVPGAPRLCLAAGVWRRRVIWSASLETHLAPPELDAALTHEAAHLRRRDPLALLALEVSGLLLLPGVARRLRAAYRAAAEEACDAEAAAHHGGDTVARALVAAARLQLAPQTAPGFADAGLSRRVTLLLHGAAPDTPPPRFLALLAALAATGAGAVIVFHLDIHHAVETVLSLVH